MSATTSNRRINGLELLIEIPAVVVTFVMMLHITANALLRTYASDPIDNTLEIVTYWYLPTVAFLGFIAAQHRGQHIAADLVFEMLPRPTRRFVLCGVWVLAAVVAFGFARFGLEEAMHAREINKTAGVSGLTSWPTYFLVPLAFGSLTIQFAWAALRSLLDPPTEHPIGDPDDAFLVEVLADQRDGAAGSTTVRKER